MGLAGRKYKQRIAADPRNLTWSNDSSKFGAKYLQSLGWTSGSGLGVSGEGRVSNIKIHQKLDLMGIGANGRGVDDPGCKMGRQFDTLLARLNQTQSAETPTAESNETEDNGSAASEVLCLPKKTKQEKRKDGASGKRKRKRTTEDGDDTMPVKRRKEEKKKGKQDKIRAEKETKEESGVSDRAEDPLGETDGTGASPSMENAQTGKTAPRFRAHRARDIASKRLAVASSTSMNEILGIAASSLSGQSRITSTIPFPVLSTPPQSSIKMDYAAEISLNHPESPSTDMNNNMDRVFAIGPGLFASFGKGLGFGASKAPKDTNASAVTEGDLLRESKQSVAEYFAEKMRLKTASKGSGGIGKSDAPKAEKRQDKRKKKERK